jgi:hypothetical protein
MENFLALITSQNVYFYWSSVNALNLQWKSPDFSSGIAMESRKTETKNAQAIRF